MGDLTCFADRDKRFQEAQCTCKELLDDRIKKIETFTGKWLPIAIGVLFVFQVLGFTCFYFAYIDVLKKIDHRYFKTKESLEEIHKVKIENGKVIRDFKE